MKHPKYMEKDPMHEGIFKIPHEVLESRGRSISKTPTRHDWFASRTEKVPLWTDKDVCRRCGIKRYLSTNDYCK